MKKSTLTFLTGILIGAAVITGGVFLFSWLTPPELHGMVLQAPKPAQNFTLESADGEIRLREFRGKYVLLFFGYTRCPDVCPVTLSAVAEALDILGERKANKLQVIMVSVDPDRDTPAMVDQHAKKYHPGFIGATGTQEQLLAAATPLGIYFRVNKEVETAADYLVDHTATMTMIDADGYARYIFPFGLSAEEIAADLDYLLRR